MANDNPITGTAPDNPDLQRYFDETAERDTRDDLRFAVSELTAKQRIAVDCGCGAGADIGYLSGEGFSVHAFDIEAEAIARCQHRYGNIEGITLAVSTFVEFNYPACSLVVADASLFFCPQPAFAKVPGKAWSVVEYFVVHFWDLMIRWPNTLMIHRLSGRRCWC